MRILLDTNILVAGMLSPKGPPGQLVRAWLEGGFELVTSQTQITELRNVFNYEKLRNRINSAQQEEILGQMDALAHIAENLPDINLSKDPADNLILASAIAGKAELIVSGDKTDMLALKKAQHIPIITAKEAVKRLSLSE